MRDYIINYNDCKTVTVTAIDAPHARETLKKAMPGIIINSTIKIESMMNLSAKRVLEPYFAKGKKVFLTREQYEDIKEIIKKYYAFEN